MAPDGYNLILAGPGSGKTRVITYRVAYLIARGVPASSILLATFTRRAAREMVHRLDYLIGQDANRVWAGTFHHVGNRLLRRSARLLGYQPNFTILDSEDQLDLIRLAMEDTGIAGEAEARSQGRRNRTLDQFRTQYHGSRSRMSSPSILPISSNGCPGSSSLRQLTAGGSWRPTAWTMTTC